MTRAGDELMKLSERLGATAARAEHSSFAEPLVALLAAADQVGLSWSGSAMGYHSLVYYEGLAVPPPGAHFNPEWGLMNVMRGSGGSWVEYPFDGVVDRIKRIAGDPDLAVLRSDAMDARKVLAEAKDEALSILRAELRRGDDIHLTEILKQVEALSAITYDESLRAQLPSGQLISRDSAAINQGVRSAPHQIIRAEVVAARAPFESATRLAQKCRSAARHLERVDGSSAPSSAAEASGLRVVIGHGRAPDWRELKDFVADRLRLPWDEFNRVSTAGVGTTDRLQQMVEASSAALIVATAEDELANGSTSARQNVIHEIGLFQGHLGFGRAIVLLEDGCTEFSNIHGLGQIRFPKGNISACFEDVRRLMEREGLV